MTAEHKKRAYRASQITGSDTASDRAHAGVYEVTVTRTEMITFLVRAISREDAEERYLMDGVETASKTTELHVDSTRFQGPVPA